MRYRRMLVHGMHYKLYTIREASHPKPIREQMGQTDRTETFESWLIKINGVELIHSNIGGERAIGIELSLYIYQLQEPNGRIDVELNIHISLVCPYHYLVI